jgi:hypothetical protein
LAVVGGFFAQHIDIIAFITEKPFVSWYIWVRRKLNNTKKEGSDANYSNLEFATRAFAAPAEN